MGIVFGSNNIVISANTEFGGTVQISSLIANGSLGFANSVLTSDGNTTFWALPVAQEGDGYTGSKGYTGSAGSNGYAGSRGFTGSKGDTGTTGYTGSASTEQGPIGYTGSIGIGYTGSQGDQGVIGYTGSAGSTGATGFTGSKGDTGFTGSASGITESGTPFPASPVDRQRFFHTGYDKEFFWDNSNSLWLSSHEYEAIIPIDEAFGTSHTASDTVMGAWHNVWKGRHSIRLKSWRYAAAMTGTGNWSIRIRDNSSNILATDTITASNYPSNISLNSTFNNEFVVIDILENSGTATITTCLVSFTYRLIGT